jgi:hypothetical protein
MFVVAAVALLSPACTRHVLQMSSPEQASTVTLFDAGADAAAENDDHVVVLDQPKRIARVAGFFQKRAMNWEPYSGRLDEPRRYQISFRKGNDVTDRFWIMDGTLLLHSPSGKYYQCALSATERTEILSMFSGSRPAVRTARTTPEQGPSAAAESLAERRPDDGRSQIRIPD